MLPTRLELNGALIQHSLARALLKVLLPTVSVPTGRSTLSNAEQPLNTESPKVKVPVAFSGRMTDLRAVSLSKALLPREVKDVGRFALTKAVQSLKAY
jgi:hypothetical protein